MDGVRQWIDGLGPELRVQAGLLRGLLAALGDDDRWEWLELGCSVAAGRGDALSDLDMGLGFSGTGEPPLDEVEAILRGLGPVVEVYDSPWDGRHRWWVQYADGGQIDIVLVPAADRPGRAPGSVALLDRHGRLAEEFRPQALTVRPDEPRRWLLDGWEALSNVAKYVHRNALYEAIEQIHRARTRALQLWAAGEAVQYPSFGLTSLLDDAGATLPAGIDATYATVDRRAILAAALASADVLARSGEHASAGLDTPLRAYVTDRLTRLA
jgi:hypothetical protein